MILFYQILQWVVAVGEVIMCYSFVDMFGNDKFFKENKIWILMCGIGIGAILAFNRRGDWGMISWTMIILESILIFISLLRRSKNNKTFIWSIILAYNVYTAFLQLLFAFILVTILKDVSVEKIYLYFSGYRILCYILSLFIVVFLFIFLSKLKNDIKYLKYSQKSIFLYGAAGVLLIIALQGQILDYGKRRSERYSFFLVEIIIATIFILVGNMRNMKNKSNIQMLEFRNKLFEENYYKIQDLYQNCMYTYHDMKNHLIVLDNYCKLGNIEAMVNYISSIQNPISSIKYFLNTGNIVLDMILNYKLGEAEKKGIKLEILADEIGEILIEEKDLCSIFSNLIDNAIDACDDIKDGNKWIKILIRKVGEMLIIVVSNSFSGLFIKEDGKYRSIKKGTHGFGMKAIKSKVEKYGGDVEWGHKNNIFMVTISFFDSTNREEK